MECMEDGGSLLRPLTRAPSRTLIRLRLHRRSVSGHWPQKSPGLVLYAEKVRSCPLMDRLECCVRVCLHPKDVGAMACAHKRQSAQRAERKWACLWPGRP